METESYWIGLSGNTSLDIKFVVQNLHRPWSWRAISRNPGITWADVQKYPDLPWDWEYLSINPNTIPEIIDANLEKPWKWEIMLQNESITVEFVFKHKDKSWKIEHYHDLANRQNIEKYPDIPWPWHELHLRRDFDWGIVSKFADKPWNWSALTDRPNLPMDLVRKLHDKPWNWQYLSHMKNLPLDLVQDFPDKPWNWTILSSNPLITEEVAQKLPDKPWTWFLIMLHSGAEITSMKHARELRSAGYKPKKIRDNALYKTVLGLPLDKPICYMPALLWLKVPIFPDKCDKNPSLARLMRILKGLPAELQEKICARIFGLTRITAEDLKCLQN